MSEPTHEDIAVAELPRLRIHHLFVLTTVFAVVMTAWLGIWRLFRSLNPNAVMPEFGAGMSFIFSVQSLSQSASFCIVLLGLAWRKRGISFPCQPGHWMAIYLAVVWAYEIVITFTSLFLQTQIQGNIGEAMAWVMMALNLSFHCFAFALWVAAYLHEPDRIWKLGWAAMALRSLFSICWALFFVGAKCVDWLLEILWYNTHFDWLGWQHSMPLGSYAGQLTTLAHYALLAFIPIATFIDLRQHRQRHWSHWLVVVSTFVSTAVLTVCYHIAF